MLKTTMKKRLNYDRFIVLSCALIVSLFILAHTGESGLTFLFLRKKFSWSLEQFTIFSAINHVFSILATMSGTYFLHDKLKISETVVILVGLISVFAGMVYFGFASYNWDIYFGKLEILGIL